MSSAFTLDSPNDVVSPSSVRSAFPFPAQDGSRPESSRYQPRRDSLASVMSAAGSIGGSLDIQQRRGSTVRETSQNAISTLLQPPIMRAGLIPHTASQAAASGFKAPTTKDIPPVTLTNVPHVPPENFRDYLNRIGPLFESFQRGRSEPESPAWLKKDKDLEKTEALERRLTRPDGSAPPTPYITRQNSAGNLSPVESPGGPRRRSSAQYRRNRNEPTPLSTIPSVYFDEDFHLENPRTFDVVSERAEIVRPPPGSQPALAANGTPPMPRKSLANNAILQEKLSWYMDTVEVHLINSISTASTGFFAALGSLKELQTEAEQSVFKIQSLRGDLKKLDQEVAISGLEVAAKQRRRQNVQKLQSATAQVQGVVEHVKRAEELVDNGAYDEAADQMDRVGRLVCGQQEPGHSEEVIDLRPLKALQGLDSGLQELQLRIGTGFAQRFSSILIEDLRRHVQKVPNTDTLRRWSRQRGVPPVYMETDDKFREDLLSALTGLARAGHTAPASSKYRDDVNKEVKAIIRRFMPSSSDDDAESMASVSTTMSRGGGKRSGQEKSLILARNLKALDDEDAEKLLVDAYTSIGEALRRVSTQTKILLDVTSSMQAPEPRSLKSHARSSTVSSVEEKLTNGISENKVTVQEELSQALDLSSLLGQAVDTAQSHITRVLKVRNEQTIRLPKHLFLRYFTLNRLFADECEAISGRGGNVLKGTINAQISGFVQVLGTSETERIAHILDSDTWTAEDFTDKRKDLLQRILASMTKDPPEWTKGTTPIWERPESATRHLNGTNASGTPSAAVTNGTAPTTTKAATPKPAYIDDTRFILVPSASSLLDSIDILLSLTSTLPTMTPLIATSLLEVLRTFDSKTKQLILGAGATKSSAGLKNITTKHLALASQALSFVVALIPYMRECVRRHVPSGQGGILADFDRMKRQYQDHQSGIHDKLVDIMTSRSTSHVKAMSQIDFDAPASDDKVNAYMETLTKETTVLHRVLSRHLSELDVSLIMRKIFAGYKEQWTKAFGDVEVKSLNGEQRLLRDAEALEVKLGQLEGFEGIGRDVVAVVKAKVSVEFDVEEEVKKEATATKKSQEAVIEVRTDDTTEAEKTIETNIDVERDKK